MRTTASWKIHPNTPRPPTLYTTCNLAYTLYPAYNTHACVTIVNPYSLNPYSLN